MVYLPLSYEEIFSPVEEELYELVDGVYVLSEDEEVDPNTVYYMPYDDAEDEAASYVDVDVEEEEITNPREAKLYEHSEDYELTDDITVNPDTIYYRFDEDTDPPYTAVDTEEEEIENPRESDLFEFVETYTLTEDTTVILDKAYYRYAADELNYEENNLELEYYPVDTDEEGITNPSEAGLFVFEDGLYEETEDTTVVDGVIYYSPMSDLDDGEEPDNVVEEDPDDVNMTPTETPVNDYEPADLPTVASTDEYVPVTMPYGGNPYAMGLYIVTNNTYILTSDTEPVVGRTYYRYFNMSDYLAYEPKEGESPYVMQLRELINGEYVFSNDPEPVSGKTYYRYDPIDPPYLEFDDPYDEDCLLGPYDGEPVAEEIDE